ncbi:tyrosine-type recombinase/integrase [Undibacterium sp. LX40W]|uniref:Tyrosine-type recombinase/integrase n=1 Tax=Undibacterium nitidum TaxID=2762298 RepID=A0A923KMV7_9BURK|nr:MULTISPECIES: site-specific integrase [Undibacterium]MBC3879948.1 tyrosine-type recombinase/integrase [Undibacterium nitidum]MBC3891316.1 tyrosine-type recombinase/integrase [Undibacterium sp. LX40W]
MSKIDQYIQAATRDNTRQSYQAAVRHFEFEWGGFLPATADNISNYLAAYAETLSINTLRQRLAALAQWHISQGFPDPTKSPVVRKVFRGIQALHPARKKQARPLQLDQLEQVVKWLNGSIDAACHSGDRQKELRYVRDKALLLVGFWRGFRGDELVRLRIEHIEVEHGKGMTCYLSQTKGDRHYKGTSFKTPALSRLCPVEAYLEWTKVSQLTSGPVFRAIDRWGHIDNRGLHQDSLVPIFRTILQNAGITDVERYSGHSLRRGFANWTNSNNWDIKTLMEYVGWKNIQSAIRYIDSADPYSQRRIESGLKKGDK